MAYLVTRRTGKHLYRYEVESYWDSAKKQSRQRILRLVGRVDNQGKVVVAPAVRVDSVSSSFPVGPCVWDRLNTHRAVTRWLERHPSVHIEYLPPYAPELNPVEHLWGYLKENPLANWAPKEIAELSLAMRYHAGRLRGRGKLLRSFLYATPLFLRPP